MTSPPPSPLAVWVYLLFGRGWFWLCRERDDSAAAAKPLADWPSVVAIIPARNEADIIARTVGTLLARTIRGVHGGPGRRPEYGWHRRRRPGRRERDTAPTRLRSSAERPPPGWTGKLWAMRQGLAEVEAGPAKPDSSCSPTPTSPMRRTCWPVWCERPAN